MWLKLSAVTRQPPSAAQSQVKHVTLTRIVNLSTHSLLCPSVARKVNAGEGDVAEQTSRGTLVEPADSCAHAVR